MLKRIIFFLALIVLLFFGYRLINQEGAYELLTDIKGRIMPREKENTLDNKNKKEIAINKSDKDKGNYEDSNGEDIDVLEKEDAKNTEGTNVVVNNLNKKEKKEKTDGKINNTKKSKDKKSTNDTKNSTNDYDASNQKNKKTVKKQIVVIDYHDEEILDRFSNNVR